MLVSLDATLTEAVAPAVAPSAAFSITRPYSVLVVTMVTESMIGGLTGLLVSLFPLSSTGTPAIAWRGGRLPDELADNRILVVAVAECVGGNEELAIVGVGSAICQRQQAGEVNRTSTLNSSSCTAPLAPWACRCRRSRRPTDRRLNHESWRMR